MSAKKIDFSKADTTQPVFGKINEVTSKPDKKPRKTYTEEEAEEAKNSRSTSGKKGMKLTRANIAFTPEQFDFLKTMSRVTGLTYSEIIEKAMNGLMQDEEIAAQYKQAVKFRESLNK